MNNCSFLKLSCLVVFFTVFFSIPDVQAQLNAEQNLNETIPVERTIKGKGFSHTQQSVVYYWTDKDGTKHYTDKPQKSQKTTRRIVITQQPTQQNAPVSTASIHAPMIAPTPSLPPQFALPSATGPLTSDLPPPTSLPPQGLPPLPQDIQGVLRPNSEEQHRKNTLFSDVKSRVL